MRPSRLFAMLAVLALLVAGCGGDDGSGDGDGNGEASSESSGGALDDTEGLPAADLIVAADPTARAMTQLAEAYAEESGDRVLVRSGRTLDIAASFAEDPPGIYVNVDELVAEDVPDGTSVAPLGTDLLQLGVRRGNPTGVTGLEAFAADSGFAVGMCEADLLCGRLAESLLGNAGIEPGPEVAVEPVPALLNGLTRDESLDAVLLLRTDMRRRFALVEQVPVPDRPTVEYTIALLSDDERLVGFYDWVTTAPEAQEILAARGLAALTS